MNKHRISRVQKGRQTVEKLGVSKTKMATEWGTLFTKLKKICILSILVIFPRFNHPDKDTEKQLITKKLIKDKTRKYEQNKEKF